MTSPAHAHTPILATRDLSIGYRHGLPVREHIEVDLTPGTLTCLVGRNGAGKSTILKSLIRQLEPGNPRCCAPFAVFYRRRPAESSSSDALCRSIPNGNSPAPWA